ncbi:MAG TPA: hypothetical protein VNJ53_12535, partial [Gaiellaceae bacterium]|nr:hypothetical protein [Gaiellaceae bacterium]
VAGLAAERDGLVAGGVVVLAVALVPFARLVVRVAATGRLGAREGPVAHVALGLAFLAEAAALALAGATGALDGRRAASACVLLVGLGWAAGVVVGHLGKLVSLSGWGSWPPGPRPSQAALYPRRLWQAEAASFAVGVQLAVAGVLLATTGVLRAGGIVLAGAALLALTGVAETLRRVASARAAG